MYERVIIEKAACEVVNQSSKPPLIFQIPVNMGRKKLEELQNTPVYMYPANINEKLINTGKNGDIKVYTVIPEYYESIRNVIFYIHGAGWVFGSFHTHEKLARELAYRTNSIVIFPEYKRSPEARFPVAIEQCYFILNKIEDILAYYNIKANLQTLTVAGDSVGGNMVIAMTLMSKFQNGPKIHKQLLYYPVTDDDFNTDSYIKFSNGYYLYRQGMIWFWSQYEPNKRKRCSILTTPLKASIEQLKGLPDAMIINGEADVLRSEGEAYAIKLAEACNDVTAIRIQGTIHDFVMLNSLDASNATRAAMDISTDWINRKNLKYDT